ncbi:SpoIIE family protein phosphatase [Streptomyces sp. F63]|uniref:SpoIIE family protein phosphatase n=1 Tax=Streptomyces sp. F63 TaxID=2824887 RepID=UPI001B37EBBC|nr:SpoIIE family protein phosphatase [Streptomyces sp. F63]MBQ0984694.1 SpoIIE family protein phosphatase [Streptomyces sp. F63]
MKENAGTAFGFAGVAMAAVYVRDPENTGGLRLIDTLGRTRTPYALPETLSPDDRSPVTDAYRTGRPVWPAPAEAVPGGAAPAAGAAAVSAGALPLVAEGGRLGCLLVVDDGPYGFDTTRRLLLEMFAGRLTTRLEADGWSRTTPVPDSVRQEATAGSVLRRIRPGACTLALDTGRIEADSRLPELFGIAPEGFDGRVETLLWRAVPDDLPALMSLIEPDERATGLRDVEFRVRLSTGELRWLSLGCRLRLDPAGRPDRLLGVVAEASRLRPRAHEVSMVQRLATALAGTTNPRDVAGALLDALGAGRVALTELTSDRLVVTVLAPRDPDAWPQVWRSAWRAEGRDAPSGSLPTVEGTLRGGNVHLWPPGTAVPPDLAGLGPGGVALLPLPAEGRTLGTCVIGWSEAQEFGPQERSLLTAAASLAGQALMRARALDAERELVTMLQRSLLPRTLPALRGGVAVARYLPAAAGLEVGGDWYDVIPLSDRQVAFVIGDVEGHSAAAATVMGQMRTAIRAYAVEGHTPDVVVSHANRLLTGMETDLFATVCYVALDMEEGNAWFVRAGHLPPVLRDPAGGTRELQVEGGPPLGADAQAAFPMTTAPIAPGSVLALMTDGLVEPPETGAEEGMRRIRDSLAAADPADPEGMAAALLGGGARRDDDLALLLLRYDGMAVRPRRAGWAVWRLPDAAAHARRFTIRTLRAWDAVEEADTVLLVVSELVTNALVHTAGEVRLDLALTGNRLRVAVSDSSPRTPVKAASMDWEATGGRGILMVEAVSESWGSVPLSGGKQVWSEIALPPRDPEPPGPEEGPTQGNRTGRGDTPGVK